MLNVVVINNSKWSAVCGFTSDETTRYGLRFLGKLHCVCYNVRQYWHISTDWQSVIIHAFLRSLGLVPNSVQGAQKFVKFRRPQFHILTTDRVDNRKQTQIAAYNYARRHTAELRRAAAARSTFQLPLSAGSRSTTKMAARRCRGRWVPSDKCVSSRTAIAGSDACGRQRRPCKERRRRP